MSRITALSKLSTLSIADGLRVYGIPEGISRLSSLQYFSYENNNLGAPSNIKGGTFPAGVSKLYFLHTLLIANSRIEGHLPRNFSKIGSKTSRGVRLILSYNMLTGAIRRLPSTVTELTKPSSE